jgi:hypothetical protein
MRAVTENNQHPGRFALQFLSVNIDVPNSESAKLQILWWTNAPRQHQMLASYDGVLTAIAEALGL